MRVNTGDEVEECSGHDCLRSPSSCACMDAGDVLCDMVGRVARMEKMSGALAVRKWKPLAAIFL
jgi:hypothetical protein